MQSQTDHQFILDTLRDGRKHCSNEMPMRDYRARVGELRRGQNAWHVKFTIHGEPCKGRCGRIHSAGVHWLWLENPHQLDDIPAGNDKRAVQTESPRINDSVRFQPYVPPKPKDPSELSAKEFYELYEEERKFRGRPLTKAEIRKAVEAYKAKKLKAQAI